MADHSRILVVSCLALSALSACKDNRALEPTAVEPALMVNGAAVDPLCFLTRDDDDSKAPVYPTQGCGGSEYVRDEKNTSPLDASFVSTGYFYVDPEAPEQKFPGFVGYKYLGEYRGLKAVELIENGGGTGMFTSVQLLRAENDGTLRVIQTLAGGDRCNGGIASAFMSGRTLVYDVNLTPYDFVSVAEYNPKNLQAYDDLDACAVCCYGTLRYVNGQPDSLALSPEAAPEGENAAAAADRPLQACFDDAFRRARGAGETVMSLKDNKKFVSGFFDSCTAP